MASIQLEPAISGHGPADEAVQGLDVVGFLRRRKAFVILLSAVGVGIGYLLFTRQVARYQSDAWVQVIHRNSDDRLKNMMAEKDLSDTDYVVKSPRILTSAFTKHNLSQLRSFRGLTAEEAVPQMVGMLTTKMLSANVVQISSSGADPADIREIANAVSEEYVSLQRENYEDASTGLQELLTRAKNEIHENLKEVESRYREFRTRSHLSADGVNPHRKREEQIQESISALELEKTQLRSELTALEEALRSNASREAVLLLVQKQTAGLAAARPPVSTPGREREPDDTERTLAERLFPLMMEEIQLAAEFGPDHPKLINVRTRIQQTQKHFRELTGLVPVQPPVEDQPVQPDFLQIYLQSLMHELQVLEKRQLDLRSLSTTEETSARALMQEEIENANLVSEKERLTKLYDGTIEKIGEVKLNADMGGVTAQVLSPARHGVLVYPQLSQFLGLGAFLGAFAGVFLGYVVEVSDKSFRKPEDLIREFGLPIIGHVPFMNEERLKSVPAGLAMDANVVTLHLPRSRSSEAYRSVRTAVCFSPAGGMHKVIQVTSPAAGDGKSTLAVNLAVSMAQSGKRTILVESDFRRPRVHKLTGVSNSVGVVDVLRGTAEFGDAVQETPQPDFFVMPCGQRPKNPSELLSRPEYEQLLKLLRDRFDVVIIDTPPVLAVTDACTVAPRIDGVILCMRLSRHARELGRRSLDALRDVGAGVVGIVINGVHESDSYGYGNYRYSDYRYYRQNYNYKLGQYGDADSREDYFADDEVADASFTAVSGNGMRQS